MDDFVLNVRQIGQYPLATSVNASDVLLLQQNGLGGAAGAYASIKPLDLLNSAAGQAATLTLGVNTKIAWNGATLAFSPTTGFTFSARVNAPVLSAPSILMNGEELATQKMLQDAFDAIVNNVVLSFNGRVGHIQLLDTDILRAGGVLAINPHFAGVVTAPTLWNPNDCSDSVATTAWVQSAICAQLESGHVVLSYNGRGGHVVPIADDVTVACTTFGQWALANTAPSGDVSKRIANTAFVDEALTVLKEEIENDFAIIADQLDQKYAPLDSPQLVGIPTAPTAAQTVNSGQIATTAFVHAAVTASTSGVSSWNGRTGAVTLNTSDVTGAGGAPILSPAFTGNPTAATQTIGDSSTRIATTAFVQAALGALPPGGVTSFNTRTGAVVLTTADVQAVGAAPIASPTFTGIPAGPTAAPLTSTTQLATTQFVTQAINALAAPVTSFNGRTGAVTFQASDVSAVGGALLASPTFTGVPSGPTATAGTSNQQLATTQFVQQALGGVVSGVSSWNTRTGAVTLTAADLSAVGGALLAGPTFTGVPSGPTATIGTNTTQLATTAFVQAALAAAPGGVSSFNGRTGAITFLASDVSAVGGALLASPSFSGNPTAPTPSPGDNDTSIATTAFVATAIASSGGVNSFNGRAGAITLTAADVQSAAGAVYRQSATAPASANETFWFDQNAGQLYVQYVDPSTSAKSWVVANTVPPPPVQQPAPGTRVLIQKQVVSAGGVTSIFFTGLTSLYDEYVIEAQEVVFGAANSSPAFRVSTDNGATWITSYSNAYSYAFSSGAGGGNGGGALSYIIGVAGISFDPPYAGYSTLRLFSPMAPGTRVRHSMGWGCGTSNTSGLGQSTHTGNWSSAPNNAVMFYGSGGATLAIGTTVILYGIAK